jgi:tripeptide aminopeptidase
LIKTWPTPIRGAICLEGGELGRLNYYSDGMIRGEIECNISRDITTEYKYKPNAILILNETINQILALKLPQRPRTRIVIGKISGGFNHGTIAYDAKLGFEIRSHSYKLAKSIYNDFKDIIDGISHEDDVYLKIKTISNLNAARLKYNHPLVKSTAAVMRKLQLTPVSEPTESELSIFLSNNIPSVTLGITHGINYYQENATIEIDPIFKGIAQVIGVIMAIDSGICDEK